MSEKILVTGAFGLVGSDLVLELQKRYGKESVICSGQSIPQNFEWPAEVLDVRDKSAIDASVKKNGITQIYHLAGILSAGSEKNPQLAWDVNFGGLKNVLDVANDNKLKVFWPSSIAAFGPTTPRQDTPQHTSLEPTTIYGVAKVAGELMCQYYSQRYEVDVRSLRYPGLIGYKAPPGDGTTEYSISIFYGALQDGKYQCFLKDDAVLPMMYMDDAILGTIKLMDAKKEQVKVRTSYNFAAISFSPKELYEEIRKLQPDFKISYVPDGRQKIADSWPKTIDDSDARKDWGWKHKFGLKEMTKEMYVNLEKKLKK